MAYNSLYAFMLRCYIVATYNIYTQSVPMHTYTILYAWMQHVHKKLIYIYIYIIYTYIHTYMHACIHTYIHCIALHYITFTLHYITLTLYYTTLHDITLHYVNIHTYITLHNITLHTYIRRHIHYLTIMPNYTVCVFTPFKLPRVRL